MRWSPKGRQTEVAVGLKAATALLRNRREGITVMLASMMPTVVLLIASLLLLDLTPLTTEDGSIWLRLVAR